MQYLFSGGKIMDEGLPSVSFVVFFVAIIINVVIHGFGMALKHATKEEIEKRGNERKDNKSSKIIALMDMPKNHVEATQILTMLINMVLGSFVVAKMGDFICDCLNISGGGPVYYLPYIIVGLVVALLLM